MAPLPSNRLIQKRLKELERERVALHRRIDTLAKLPDDFSPLPAPPAGPRVRPPAIPDEWRITRPDAARAADAARSLHVAAAVAPGASPEFAPAPAGVRVRPSSAPAAAPRLRNATPAAVGEDAPPPDRLGTYLGAQPGFRRPGHVRTRPEGSYRARAVFAVLMVLLLGFLAIRLFT